LKGEKLMKPLTKSLSTIAILGALAALMPWSGAKRAEAQTKGIVVPQLVRNIDEPGFNPFQESQTILFTNFSGDATLPIPAGKVAVIEQVSASGAVQTGGVVQVFVRCRNGDVEVNQSLALFPHGEVNGLTAYAGGQAFKCYASAAPGILNIHVQASNFNTAQHTWVMAASGYLVPQ
jgi:hypothetical protein